MAQSKLMVFLIMAVLCASVAFAASVTLATGGSAISSATVGGNFTNLTGPVITEAASMDVGNGTIKLTVPSGFEFDTGASVTVLMTSISGSGAAAKQINNVATGTSMAITSINSTTIVFTVTDTSNPGPGGSSVIDSLTFQNVRVRPTAALPLASGDITLSGNSSIVGVASGSSMGALTEVASDTTPPVVTVPSNMTVEATAASGASASFSATALDAVDGAIVPTCVPASGSTFALGATSVNCSATDAAANTGSALFTITVVDTTAPVLTLPADITVEAASPSGMVVDYFPSVSATDLVDASPSLFCAPPGGTFPIGTTPIICTATDDFGNSAIDSFDINVVDTTAPVLTVPADVVGFEATGALTVVPIGSASATDVADSNVTITNDAPANFPLGDTVVTWTATDDSGNSVLDTQTINVVDTTAPVLSGMPGDDTVEATSGAGVVYPFTDPTATDVVDPSPAVVCVPASGDTFPLGITTVTCTATDAATNSAFDTFDVTVRDTTIPVIDFHADEIAEATSPGGAVVFYTAPATSDAVDGPGVASCVSGPGAAFGMGTTSVTCTATDAAGNSAIPTIFDVTVSDTTAPVITLTGSDPVTVEVGTPYVDAGATASDIIDGDVTASIITVNPVDSATVGTYTVTYNVADAAENDAVEVTRTVNVVDTTPPIITIIGANPIDVSFGTVYADDGATALDVNDGDVTGSIVTDTSAVDTSTLGTYTVTYDVTDANGNSAHEERTVNVVDLEIPIITLLGASPVDVAFGGVYVDDGATALDDVDGDLTGSIVTVNPVDTSILGTYTVTYNVADAAGNDAAEVTRTVNVVDSTMPVITLTGSDPVTVEVGAPYVDDGATASDDVDGDITDSIVTVNPVDSATVGTYTVTYNVADAAGNDAVEVTRTVNVVDTTAPTLDSAVTQDSDGDGEIDSIVLTFNEDIDDEMLDVGTADGWDVSGYDVESIGTGATANDNVLVLAFAESGTPDTSATPTVTYTVSGGPVSTHDLAGNELGSLESSTTDGAAPLLLLVGSSPVSVSTGGVYTEEGATLSDAGDSGDSSVVIGGDVVNTSAPGTYTVTYDFTDGWGNEAVQITRTVTVSTPTPPRSGGGGGGGGGGYTPPLNRQPPVYGPVTFPSVEQSPPGTGGTGPTGGNSPPTGGSTLPQDGANLVLPPQGAPGPNPPTGITPQATGVFNLGNNPQTWSIGLLALLLAALGIWAYTRRH